jgi:uncharacterized protein YicC (UPF0701 family)
MAVIKKMFDEAFNSGNIQEAANLVNGFAQQYSISFSEAESVIENFKAAQATIPKTIEEQLIGKAQSDMQAFKDCMTGKTASLSSDAVGHMETMAGDITELIRNGLVGEAQNAMQAYVDCNTNKAVTMTTKISDSMKTLTSNYNEQLQKMRDLGDTLTGQEKDAVLAQIDELTSGYREKMWQLKDWQAEILDQMKTNTTDSFTEMTDSALFQAKKMSNELVMLSIWPDMLEEMNRQTKENLGAVEKRFSEMGENIQIRIPSVSSLNTSEGIRGTASGHGGIVNINITGPLVNIEGNADKKTVDLAANQVLAKLKTIIVEPTSSNAPSTQKRIRSGAIF